MWNQKSTHIKTFLSSAVFWKGVTFLLLLIYGTHFFFKRGTRAKFDEFFVCLPGLAQVFGWSVASSAWRPAYPPGSPTDCLQPKRDNSTNLRLMLGRFRRPLSVTSRYTKSRKKFTQVGDKNVPFYSVRFVFLRYYKL